MRGKLNDNEAVIGAMLFRFITLKDSLFKLNCMTGEAWILHNTSLTWKKLKDETHAP